MVIIEKINKNRKIPLLFSFPSQNWSLPIFLEGSF
jgi:hypothetical protein